MQTNPWIGRKFWLNAGLSLSVAGMPWTATISLLGTSALATLTAAPVQAATLSGWDFDPSTQALMVTVPGGTTPHYFLAAEPARIVMDLPDTQVGSVPLQQSYDGAIREIRVAQFEPGVTRIVLELAPGTVLAPGHVALQQAEATGTGDDRWVLRPLLAGDPSVAMASTPDMSSTPDAASTPAAPASAATAAPASELPPLEPGATEIPVQSPPDAVAMNQTPTADATIAPANLGTAAQPNPPNEPAQSVRMPFGEPAQPEVQPDTQPDTQPETVRLPGSEAAIASENTTATPSPSSASSPQDSPQDTNAEATALPDQPASTMASLPTLPDASPNALPDTSGTGTVSVPPLSAEPAEAPAAPQPLTPTLPQSSPQADTAAPSAANFPTPDFSAPNSPAPSAPSANNPNPAGEPGALSSQPSPEAVSEPASPVPAPSAPGSIASTPAPNAAIEFGQPLPKSASGGSIAYNSNSNGILLPAGTVLNLRYTGEAPLELDEDSSRQEVLVLSEAVRDAAGNVVLPEGSQVLGRFETGEAGSQFITQAISLQGQTVLLNAQSEPLSGQRSNQNHLFRNSALGVAAGVALGLTGIGLIPAIAAGAATTAGITFLPGSHSNAVQPDQVLEVKLTQDFTQAN